MPTFCVFPFGRKYLLCHKHTSFLTLLQEIVTSRKKCGVLPLESLRQLFLISSLDSLLALSQSHTQADYFFASGYESIFMAISYVLIIIALQYSLKSENVMPPAPFFFLRTALAMQGLLCFHRILGFFFYFLLKKKSAIGILIGIALNL